MEILQDSLKKITKEYLSPFERKVWGVMSFLLSKLIYNELSNESSVGQTFGIDVFLKKKDNDFVLYISLTEDRLYINSKYFDIYVYPEYESTIVKFLLSEILQGNYVIELGYGGDDEQIYGKVRFKMKELEGFNEADRVGVFTKKPKKKKIVGGLKWIGDPDKEFDLI
ncbi:hypothetical protein J2X69_003316 [Algoriphagus sp. 4150]|uniref:hypothetical protein n=1 Tax=Algoriphagus sp. 4150 TaxID=2817756 RepID=UPI00285C17B4|nr:hypothetical protein [Algoriphagus sp. 4150]MDR7130957.1 hypothetical protein [Algoriphagus sp. 4150]